METVEIAAKKKRASRLSRKSDARHIVTHRQLTHLEKDVLKYAARFPFITNNHLAHALGRQKLRRVVQTLKDERNDYMDLCKYQRDHFFQQFMNAELAYGVTAKTREMLADKGYFVHTNEFSGSYFYHTLFSVQLRSSFDIAAAQIEDVDIISWHEIAKDPRVSRAALEGDRPNHFKIPPNVRTPNGAHSLIPDCYPFIVKSNSKAFPFLGIEADMGSESVSVTIRSKLIYYSHILQNDLHKTLYGFPKAYVAFFAKSKPRMMNMLAEAEKTVPEKLRPYFLFMHTIAPGDPEDNPLATGYAVTDEYLRPGHKPLCLYEESAG
jgi:hypothetical protein